MGEEQWVGGRTQMCNGAIAPSKGLHILNPSAGFVRRLTAFADRLHVIRPASAPLAGHFVSLLLICFL